jgi:hypothetical protein
MRTSGSAAQPPEHSNDTIEQLEHRPRLALGEVVPREGNLNGCACFSSGTRCRVKSGSTVARVAVFGFTDVESYARCSPLKLLRKRTVSPLDPSDQGTQSGDGFERELLNDERHVFLLGAGSHPQRPQLQGGRGRGHRQRPGSGHQAPSRPPTPPPITQPQCQLCWREAAPRHGRGHPPPSRPAIPSRSRSNPSVGAMPHATVGLGCQPR